MLDKIPNKNVQHMKRYHAAILHFDLKESCVDWWFTKHNYHFICQNPPLIYDIVAKWLVVMCCIEIMLKKIRRAFKEKNYICLECQHPFRRYGGDYFLLILKGGQRREVEGYQSKTLKGFPKNSQGYGHRKPTPLSFQSQIWLLVYQSSWDTNTE